MSRTPQKTPAPKPREEELYAPVKSLLEGQGYEVKGEIGAVDVMALRGAEPPVIVELKTGFSLTLFHQGIARQTLTDHVYIAVPHLGTKQFQGALKSNLKLCRRLGLGLITVRLRDGHVQIHIDPGPYQPRISKPKRARLLREFAKLEGDPNTGGQVRQGLMTAYRQDAQRVQSHLHQNGPAKAAEVAKVTGVARARAIMADNHYGWFERIARGIYALSPKGRAELQQPEKAD
ncbi:MAG: DUF2161 domain-containing phosphodiesterase [Paracoccaceae bacterium]